MVHGGARACQFVHQIVLADRQARFRVVDDVGELARAKHRHGGDADGSNLLHRQPRRHEQRTIQKTHEHPVSGLHAKAAQRMADPVRHDLKIAVRHAAVVADDRRALGRAMLDVSIEQRRRQVQHRRIAELWRVPHDRGP